MHVSKKRGFTLVEMVLVCAIICIVIAIGGIAWQRASVNRKLDATASAFESTLVLARQTAQNRNGAKIVLSPPSTDTEGKWELYPAGESNATSIGPIPCCLGCTTDPTSATEIEFNSAGGINTDKTSLNSEGNVSFTFEALGYDRNTVITLVGMTGAVVKN